MNAVTNGSQDDIAVSPDAAKLPESVLKVKAKSPPQPQSDAAPYQHFDETIALEIPLNHGREKLVVSKLVAQYGTRFLCVRFWNRHDDGSFRPSKRGLNVRLDMVERVAAAMLKAARS
jgi:hypothetical protein